MDLDDFSGHTTKLSKYQGNISKTYIPELVDDGRYKLPAVFLSHGPPNLLDESDERYHVFRENLQTLGQKIPSPVSVVCVSSHWEADMCRITAGLAVPIVYDYEGYPDSMKRTRFRGRGDPKLAARVHHLLEEAGISCALDHTRGFDHGCWMPLHIMYPDAEINVVQVSLINSMDPRLHFAMGRALSTVRGESTLLVCSGGAVHNLMTTAGHGDTPPWAINFDDWLSTTLGMSNIEERDKRLMHFVTAPGALLSHPRHEHFMPLLVAAGSGGAAWEANRGWCLRTMSMASYVFELASSKQQGPKRRQAVTADAFSNKDRIKLAEFDQL